MACFAAGGRAGAFRDAAVVEVVVAAVGAIKRGCSVCVGRAVGVSGMVWRWKTTGLEVVRGHVGVELAVFRWAGAGGQGCGEGMGLVRLVVVCEGGVWWGRVGLFGEARVDVFVVVLAS